MTTAEEIRAKLRQLAIDSQLCCQLQSAHAHAFMAACYAGDGVKADAERATLHALLDQLLDHNATSTTLTRKLLEQAP